MTSAITHACAVAALGGLGLMPTITAFAAADEDLAPEAHIPLLLERDDVFVALPEAQFLALGAELTLPDGGRLVTELAKAAPGGALDFRMLEHVAPEMLGYAAEWCVERFEQYGLDWDITGLKLTSADPEAADHPWLVIINGGAANVYEFFLDLENEPGWAQYLAQKLNVMIVSIPGNFRYGGWTEALDDEARQPRYLLDVELPADELRVRHAVYTNRLIMTGLKQLLAKHTTGPLLIIGHSTSGELAFLANQDEELGPRLGGRFLGWGSGAPARLRGLQEAKQPREGGYGREMRPVDVLARRNPVGYSRDYSRWLNPLYEPGMSTLEIAERWLEAERYRRPNFKQSLQDLEHGTGWIHKGEVERQIEALLDETGNPWGIDIEDVSADLFSTAFTRMDGFNQMVWAVARFDRNHWVAEAPLDSWEVFIAEEFRRRNPDATIRLMLFDVPMTHYGHVELPRQLAAAFIEIVRWMDAAKGTR